jgi:hypothetical protein
MSPNLLERRILHKNVRFHSRISIRARVLSFLKALSLKLGQVKLLL